VKALSRPQKAEDYKIELPGDFKAPEGIEFKFDDKDPILAQAREQAHAQGMSQDGFSKMLGLYAAAKVGEQAQIDAARTAEIGKLGSNAGARVDAVLQFFTGIDTTTDKRDARAMGEMLVAARHVEAFERMITNLTAQGATPFSQRHRDVPDEKPSDTEFNGWSYTEQREYSSTGKRPSRAN
jgi:hypothetical protein